MGRPVHARHRRGAAGLVVALGLLLATTGTALVLELGTVALTGFLLRRAPARAV